MTPSDQLKAKLEKIAELGKIIALSSERVLPTETRQEIDNEQFRLEFALRKLVDEVKEREADLKIKSMEKIVLLLNPMTHA